MRAWCPSATPPSSASAATWPRSPSPRLPGCLAALVLARAGRRPRRAGHRLLLDPGERRLLHHAHARLLADVLRLCRSRSPGSGPRTGSTGVPRPAVLGRGRSASPARFHVYLLVARRRSPPSSSGGSSARPSATCCAASTRTRRAWRRSGYPVDRYKLLAFVHRGDAGGPRRLALRAVQRLDLAGRLLLEDLRRGAADGHHRRHRHARRRRSSARPPSSCSRAWSRTYTERWMLILGRDLRPLRALRPGRDRGRAARARRAPRVTRGRSSPSTG